MTSFCMKMCDIFRCQKLKHHVFHKHKGRKKNNIIKMLTHHQCWSTTPCDTMVWHGLLHFSQWIQWCKFSKPCEVFHSFVDFALCSARTDAWMRFTKRWNSMEHCRSALRATSISKKSKAMQRKEIRKCSGSKSKRQLHCKHALEGVRIKA